MSDITKEEILLEFVDECKDDASQWEEDTIYKAMELYATQEKRKEAIALLKWVGKTNYDCVGYDHKTEEPLFANASMQNETAETVYEMYQYSKQNP